MDASDHADERPPRQPYVEPLVGERRACRCLKCGSCGGTFLHDAPISDFKCPGCGLVLCQSCADAGHGNTGQHGKLDPAKVNRDLRARAERAEKALLELTKAHDWSPHFNSECRCEAHQKARSVIAQAGAP